MRNRGEKEDEIVAEFQRLGFEIVEGIPNYDMILHRVMGDQSMWVELYYENGGSWMPSEGFYINVVIGDMERDQNGRLSFLDNANKNAILRDRMVYLGRSLADASVFKTLDRFVTGLKERRAEELRKAYTAYQKVAGLSWEETIIADDA